MTRSCAALTDGEAMRSRYSLGLLDQTLLHTGGRFGLPIGMPSNCPMHDFYWLLACVLSLIHISEPTRRS